MSTKLVAYYRVSTQKQGMTGLGMDAQAAAVAAHAQANGARVVAAFTEVESGKRSDRPELARAIAHAKLTKSTLVIAKLDRLGRKVAMIATMLEEAQAQGVAFVCCDNPHANSLTIHILAAVAQDEAERISARTKAALAAYKAGNRVSKRTHDRHPGGVPPAVQAARGGKLGAAVPECRNATPEGRTLGLERSRAARMAKAAAHAAGVGPDALELRASGLTLAGVAAGLNARGYVTRTGKPFTHVSVLRLLNRVS